MVGIKVKRLENALFIAAFVILSALGIGYFASGRMGMVYDALISIGVLALFWKIYSRLNQDTTSCFFFIFALILHNLGLYSTSPLGIRFDHYMHFVGGFAVAIIADRILTEKFGAAKRFALIVIFAIGIGAIGEVIEWLGYAILGSGEGFLFYGSGDEGEWRNAIFDMIFNSAGAMAMAGFALLDLSRLAQMIKYKKGASAKILDAIPKKGTQKV